MARGRMVNREICMDRKISDLSCDLSRLAFTWLVSFADKEGRVRGDPAIVRSMLFPRRDDVTVEQVESYITEWADASLIVWYETHDDMWIWFPAFEKNQPGLRKEREPESIIPPLSDDCRILDGRLSDDCRMIDGRLSDDCRQKGREGKGKEGNGKPAADASWDFPGTPKTTEHEMFDALVVACNVADVTDRFRGWANKKIKSLLKTGISPPDVFAFKTFWESSEWRAANQRMKYTAFTSNFDTWVSQGKPKSDPGTNGSGGGHGKNGRNTKASWARSDGHTQEDIDRIVAKRRAKGRPG